jgi:hypothetical protein
MLTSLVHWLETHQSGCSWKSTFGIECPGCGTQTALIELLKGHLGSSLNAYPALLPMIFMIIFLFLHVWIKFRNGSLILKILFIFTVSIMFIHYFFQLSAH